MVHSIASISCSIVCWIKYKYCDYGLQKKIIMICLHRGLHAHVQLAMNKHTNGVVLPIGGR